MNFSKLPVLAAIILVLSLTGLTACSSEEKGTSTQIDTSEAEDKGENGGQTGSSPSAITDGSRLDTSALFTERDLNTSWSATAAKKIVFENDKIQVDGNGAEAADNKLTLSAGGTYVVSGTLSDGQIVVDVTKNEKVRLVLDSVDLTCSDSACILIKEADKVFITLADGSENFLSDTGAAYVQTDDTMNVDAVVFSKSDLVFNGNGSLSVEAGYHDAVVSKDDLKFIGGTYDIKAADKAIVGKDSVRIKDGTFTIVSQDDALHTSNEEKEGKGYIFIGGGIFNIMTGDDALHAATAIVVKDGTINIPQCYEGFEADTIDIDGGSVSITSVDDGLNASLSAGGSSDDDDVAAGGGNTVQTGCYICISGGTVNINSEGDGFDSNGSIIVEGGSIVIDGPVNDGTSSLDAGTDILLNGGTIISVGSSGMAKAPSEKSGQYSVFYIFPDKISGGTQVDLLNRKGKSICSFTPAKDWSCLILSTPDLAKGTYTIKAGDKEAQIEISSMVSASSQGE